jgi:flavin reductase (DIM6/NTAB) family NADH-FMN oxidoreductase RutF
MRIDPNGLEARDLYRLMISVVVPRPIAWVSTKSAAGVLNAAPFSYFQALSGEPPMVMIAVGQKRGGEFKDTRANIEETGEFVINIVNEASGPAMVRTSVAYESGISEFDEVGLTPVASEIVAPPRIGESPVALECKLDRIIEIGTSGVCIGEVVLFHLADEIVDPETGVADPAKLAPLGRLGGSLYAPLRDIVSIDTEGNVQPVDPA